MLDELSREPRWWVGALSVAWILTLGAGPLGSVENESPGQDKASELEETAAAEEARAPSTGSRAAGEGLRIYVDPVTGELTATPTVEQRRALSRAIASRFRRSTEGLEPFTLSGGGRGVALQGRFQSATVVRVKPDGTLEFDCVSHTHADEASGSQDSSGKAEQEPELQ